MSIAELKLVVAPEGEELPPAEELAALEAQEIAEAQAAAAAKPAETEYLPEAEDATMSPAEAAEAERGAGRRRAGRPARPPTRPSRTTELPSTGSPPACGQRSTDYPHPASACGFRAEVPAKTVRFVHYREANRCSIIPA